MSNDESYRVNQWTPPTRPEWVRRVNEEGSYLDIRSIVPLDEASLIACAKANTGPDDFGDDEWYEPFKLFLKSLEQDSGLNLMGRIMTRSDLLMYLEARLRIEDTYKKHPEIEARELAPSMLIVGSGRSGTSAMQTLLGLDPDNGITRHWEALFPCPPPEAATHESDYRELGIELSTRARAAMEAYIRDNPREARPLHKYNVGDERKRAAERKLFERYQSMFKVRNEI